MTAVELNSKKPMDVLTSTGRNAGLSFNIKMANIALETMQNVRYLILTKNNNTEGYIKRSLNCRGWWRCGMNDTE